MKELLNVCLNAEELHVCEYGEIFFLDLFNLISEEKLDKYDAIDIINCLTHIDEIRILLASEIRECINTFAIDKKYDKSLLDLFHIMSDAYGQISNKQYKAQMQDIIYDLISCEISIEQAKKIIRDKYLGGRK